MMSNVLESLRAKYVEECAKRDATNALNEPLELELTAINEQIEGLKTKAREIASKIDSNRAAAGHRETKKSIGKLASAIMSLR